MTQPEGKEEGPTKIVPPLSDEELDIASRVSPDDAAYSEAKLFSSGATVKAWKKNAAEREEDRAEAFRDHFEKISIISMWFLFGVFAILTAVWAINLVIPKKYQPLDDNQEDKLQLIITGGFVAGLASSHIKKRLGS